MEQQTLLASLSAGGGHVTDATPAHVARPEVGGTPMSVVAPTPAMDIMAPPTSAPAAPHKAR
jgi:hypothetical protein